MRVSFVSHVRRLKIHTQIISCLLKSCQSVKEDVIVLNIRRNHIASLVNIAYMFMNSTKNKLKTKTSCFQIFQLEQSGLDFHYPLLTISGNSV